jgi:hypothetical protein
MRHNYLHETDKLMKNKRWELSGEKSIFSSPQFALQANRGCCGRMQREKEDLRPFGKQFCLLEMRQKIAIAKEKEIEQ